MYLVICNAPPEESKAIARKLVAERLAACINIIEGVSSIYWWKDRLCEEGEHTLLIKTSKEKVAAMNTRLLELHPYTVPEVLTFSPEQVHPPYLAWVKESTGA